MHAREAWIEKLHGADARVLVLHSEQRDKWWVINNRDVLGEQSVRNDHSYFTVDEEENGGRPGGFIVSDC